MKFLYASLILLAIFGYSFSVGRTAQLNLAFSIGAKDDNITVGTDYVSAEDSGIILAIVSSGTATARGNITAYSANEYMLQLTQALEDNRFLITITNGTSQTIESRLRLLGSRRILPKTFGSVAVAVPTNLFLFLRLEYEDLDITTRTRWSASPTQLIIRNDGPGPRGPMISIDTVK